MRALANVDGGVIKAEIDLGVPPERVFRSLTDGAELEAWWGADDMYRTFDWVIDLREGGKWSARARGADGMESTVDGTYLAVDPPRRLVYTWRPSWDDYVETTVECVLQEIPTGTRLLVTHTGFGDRPQSAAGTTEGWKRVLEWLGSFVEASGA
ncbi:MAG TPA: SRPBCC domain-containing protein [Gemmatimonadaceae bacterium]|nr:SRPBCC domain-containing protein [Gemmatimonadaceae bacterium]